MTSRHQHEREFDFTLTELRHLLTTQRLAEEKDRNWNFNPDKLDDSYQVTVDDVMKFGWVLQDAMAEGKTSVPIKMSVVYRLVAVWNSMSNQILVMPKDSAVFTQEDIKPMLMRMAKYYNNNVKDK